MGITAKFTHFVVLIGVSLIAAPAQAVTHLAEKELPISQIFPAGPARFARELSSVEGAAKGPILSFSESIGFDARGEARLGESCFVRNLSRTASADGGYYGAPLTQAPGGSVASGVPFALSLSSLTEEHLQLDLQSLENLSLHLQLECSHPSVQMWSVSDFEASSGNRAAIRVPSYLLQQATLGEKAVAQSKVMELKGSRYNGFFGSGLPKTHGIQLLFGAHLKAYGEESGTPIMAGRRCRILSQSENSLNDRYVKGSKFSFLGFIDHRESNSVELAFANWNQSPHQIRIECKGTGSEVAALSLDQIERDLNGALKFYKK